MAKGLQPFCVPLVYRGTNLVITRSWPLMETLWYSNTSNGIRFKIIRPNIAMEDAVLVTKVQNGFVGR